MAAEEGFEPSQTESESAVLPLHNSALFFIFSPLSSGDVLYYIKNPENVKGFSKKNFIFLQSHNLQWYSLVSNSRMRS